ncbi:MAG: phosphoribosylanthranilate isomerase, partial [Candidatus Omnitrophica bacterium]|nr:phosphoribosylanthranilate isomerase [Candidatus Omnitrophota bacterium]
MVKVKICGITNLEDAKAALKAGCDALGFVFYRKSPRYIEPEKAKEIIKGIPQSAVKIGVFVNEKLKNIKDVAKECRLNFLQFHGDESPEFCAKFKDHKIIKAFRVKDRRIDLKKILKYKTSAYLFDTFEKSNFGGTGKRFNWKFLSGIDNISKPVFLSGGLNEKNIKEALTAVHPDWVDVSSSVEKTAGKKDHKKVRDFIKAAK